jgi:hypothetical protein
LRSAKYVFPAQRPEVRTYEKRTLGQDVRLRGKDSNVLYIQTRTSTPPPRSLILTKPACPKPSATPISTCTHPSNPNSPKIAQKSDRASGSVNQPMADPHPATSNHTHAGYIWGLCESGAIAMSGWRAFRDLYAPSVERLLYRTVEKAALFSTSHTHHDFATVHRTRAIFCYFSFWGCI